jgi:hypothetical protein
VCHALHDLQESVDGLREVDMEESALPEETCRHTVLGGVDARSAVRLGVLLNCRGLTELVMLGVGHEMGLLTTTLFTLLVLVTLLTTAMTAPLLALLDRLDTRAPQVPEGSWVRRGEPGDRSPVGDSGHHQDEVASGSSGLPHT